MRRYLAPSIATIGCIVLIGAVLFSSPQMTPLGRAAETAFLVLVAAFLWFRAVRRSQHQA